MEVGLRQLCEHCVVDLERSFVDGNRQVRAETLRKPLCQLNFVSRRELDLISFLQQEIKLNQPVHDIRKVRHRSDTHSLK